MAKKVKHELDDIIKRGNLMFMGGLTGATAMTGGVQVAGQVSGMINKNTRGGGAASGALQGASMGMALGPWGAGAGALIGGAVGLINGGKAADKLEQDDFNNSMNERNSLLGLRANGGYIDGKEPFLKYRDAQELYTSELAKKYPKIPIKDILNRSVNDNNFSNLNTNQLSDSLRLKYGDAYLNRSEMDSLVNKEGYPDIMKLDESVKNLDKESSGMTVNTIGKKESSNDNFGYRMMLQRAYEGGTTPYKLLEKANGGYILPLGTNPNQTSMYKNGGGLTEFNSGSSHENNPYQGVPQGVSADGQQNKVEEGETKWKDYIFSDRLLLDKNSVEQYNLPTSMKGKTFADASKKLSNLIKERPNDPISKVTHTDYMKQLIMANDSIRETEESNLMAKGGRLYKGGDWLNFDPSYNANSYANADISAEMQPLENPMSALSASENSIMFGQDNINPLFGIPGPSGSQSNIPSWMKDSKNLRYAPIAFDALAATGLLGKTPTPKEYNPSLIQQRGKLNPGQIDEMQMRNSVDSAFQTGVSGLSEASGGSGSALRAGLSGLNSDYMSGIGSAYAGANKSNIDTRMQADQFNLGMDANVAQQNAQMLNQASLYNADALNKSNTSDYDARMSYLAKGAEGLGDIGYEARMSEVMKKIYGYDQYGNYITPLKKSHGGRLRLKNCKK